MVKRKEHADNEQAQMTERLENMRAAWQHASNGQHSGTERDRGDQRPEPEGNPSTERPRGRHAAD